MSITLEKVKTVTPVGKATRVTTQIHYNKGVDPEILSNVSRDFDPSEPAKSVNFLNVNVPGIATLDCTR